MTIEINCKYCGNKHKFHSSLCTLFKRTTFIDEKNDIKKYISFNKYAHHTNLWLEHELLKTKDPETIAEIQEELEIREREGITGDNAVRKPLLYEYEITPPLTHRRHLTASIKKWKKLDKDQVLNDLSSLPRRRF